MPLTKLSAKVRFAGNRPGNHHQAGVQILRGWQGFGPALENGDSLDTLDTSPLDTGLPTGNRLATFVACALSHFVALRGALTVC